MNGQITPPVFVLYKSGRIAAFDEVFEAEMTPVEHFERIERVVDGYGRELRFVVKHQLAARLEIASSPDEGRLREMLVPALQDIGDIDVEGLLREELVSRALESFRLRKKAEAQWSKADWSGAFVELIARMIFDR